MDMPRLSKSIRRVTVLKSDGRDGIQAVTIFKQRRKRKKGTAAFRPLERLARTLAKATDASAGTYLRRYKKSNRKRRDGWIRDMPINSMRASRKALKELSPGRLLSF